MRRALAQNNHSGVRKDVTGAEGRTLATFSFRGLCRLRFNTTL